ncbi:MAG: GTPase Der [Syntrophomonadaceae bacterium]|nr:GTPase Der [Bacillota bacterium]MBT9146396.1 GTPase Der [Bacillota bacterium]
MKNPKSEIMKSKTLPLVAIVGRPNVGKSTLFNRIIGRRRAIITSEPGATRDRIYGEVAWKKGKFSLVDTGGLILDASSNNISSLVRKQAGVAIEEANLILFLVDGREGLVPADEDVEEVLRKASVPIILVVNKIDSRKLEEKVSDFYSLGLRELLCISAEHGLNINQLLEHISTFLSLSAVDDIETRKPIIVSVVGRPNVGKSSFINKLLGEERLIVDDKPGTTHDAVDTFFRVEDEEFTFVDTAGMRSRARVKKGIESYSGLWARKSIERSDISLLLIDITSGATTQDAHIGSYVCQKGRGCILVANKWDLVKKKKLSSNVQRNHEMMIRKKLHFLRFAPIIFTSSITGEGVFEVINLIRLVSSAQNTRVERGILDALFGQIKKEHPPPSSPVKPIKIKYIRQVGVKPPTFRLFANHPQFLSNSYLSYLSNRLRRAFGFEGTPIRVVMYKGTKAQRAQGSGFRAQGSGLEIEN